eukprot:scaffold24438_cov122-Cylindrotheca_fusiformis.AAC.2
MESSPEAMILLPVDHGIYHGGSRNLRLIRTSAHFLQTQAVAMHQWVTGPLCLTQWIQIGYDCNDR